MNIALIPARKGSKRLPRKNVLPLNGKPLISYTIEAVLESRCFDTIIVSSDDPEVINIAGEYNNLHIRERPKHLAADTATTSQVMAHILNNLQCREGACGIFLPTSPFRSSNHIRDAFNSLSPTVDSVISVRYYSAPVAFRMLFMQGPNSQLELPNDCLLHKGKTRTQEYENHVHPNGAIYLSWITSFIKSNSFFHGTIYGYLMNKLESMDIDTIEDYMMAQALISIINQDHQSIPYTNDNTK